MVISLARFANEVIHRFNGEVNHEIVLCDTSSLIFSSKRYNNRKFLSSSRT